MNQLSPSTPEPGTGQRGRGPLFALGIACGGCLILGVVAVVAGGLLIKFGLGFFAEQVEADLRDNPVIIEHLGQLEELKLDFEATLAAPGEDDYVFEASGTKGTGTLRVTSVTVDDETEDVVAGTLQLASGEEFDLFPKREKRLEAQP